MCFTPSLLESSVPGVSKTVRNRLLPRVAKLKKYDSKGVAVVLKLLSSWINFGEVCVQKKRATDFVGYFAV